MRTITRITALIAAGLLALTLAACTSGGTGSAAPAGQPPMAAVIADQAGATDVQAITPTLYAYDEATAVLHGSPVDIATFRSNDLRDRWLAVATQFGGVVTTGDRYAIIDG